MSTESMGSLALALMLLVAGANLLGQLAVRLHQPRVVGEILAGILLGPSLFGLLAPSAAAADLRRRREGSRQPSSWVSSTTWDYCFSCSCPARACAMCSERRTGSRRPGSSVSARRYHSSRR